MRKLFGVLIVLGLAATPALAQKVYIDYAHDFDFDAVKRFQYVETKDSDVADPLMADRIVSMIKKELVEGGLKEVTENPDLFVTYHVTTRENQVYNTTHMGYGGWGPGWGAWGGGVGIGMSSSTTTASTYVEGTLIIDAYEPADKKLVWRGSGTVTLKAKPEKQIRQVEKILTKMGARWEKILAKQGK
jgi:hypothetical protein